MEHAYKVGRFIGWYYHQMTGKKCKVVIGKDTRRSSYMFEYSLVAGLTASGADAYLLHVTTTPSVSYVTRTEDFDCGIMISASHNPFYDNGIKLINGNGEKMDEKTISYIEDYIDGKLNLFGEEMTDVPFAVREEIGCTVDYAAGRNRYVGYLISLATYSYKNMRVGLDCANGSSWMIAKSVFDALGAKTYVINAEPDGTNINNHAGSTHIEVLQKFVKDNNLDVGFAYDGETIPSLPRSCPILVCTKLLMKQVLTTRRQLLETNMSMKIWFRTVIVSVVSSLDILFSANMQQPVMVS